MEQPGSTVIPPIRRRWRRLLWAAVCLLGMVIALGGAGAVYQRIAGDRDRKAFPPPGRLVDAGGFRMHLYCVGQGSPTVVFDSGLSDGWIQWYKVQPKVAEATRACAYDRAGLGWSDPSPRPRTSGVIAEELHTLLRNAGIRPPFVLVGHSMGGLDVRLYASRYRDEVGGMVLVDASHPEQLDRFPLARSGSDFWQRIRRRDARLMGLGIPRLLGWCGTALPERAGAFRAYDCTVRQKLGAIAEEDGVEASLSEVRGCGPLGDMPLVVLTAVPKAADPQTKAFLDVWMSLQEDLVRLSSRGSHVVAKGSGHSIQLDRPDLVIQAVLQVVAAARAG